MTDAKEVLLKEAIDLLKYADCILTIKAEHCDELEFIIPTLSKQVKEFCNGVGAR